jgi:hypothetical protein
MGKGTNPGRYCNFCCHWPRSSLFEVPFDGLQQIPANYFKKLGGIAMHDV